MKKTKRSSPRAPGFAIAAISLMLCISVAALTYALTSGRLSLRNSPTESDNEFGAAPNASAEAAAKPTEDAVGVPVSGSDGLPGASCVPGNEIETGTVVEVLDGDTIRVRLDRDGTIYPVHYAGLDAPDSRTTNEFFGTEAALKNAELVSGQTVTLVKDVSETDRYGQLLRYVLTETAFINYEMVAQGYAHSLEEPPDTACARVLAAAEAQASGLKLGLWSASSEAPCSCTGSELECLDFDTQKQSQACLDYCLGQGYGDPFDLDYDDDGMACEQLP